MLVGEVIVKIKNCNCIREADIKIEESILNIKYGPNGTGKSTISKAILAKAQGNETELNKLQSYNQDDLPCVENVSFTKVRVFDESYVNSYLFKEKSFLENSYQVFLRSEECEQLSAQIAVLLQELQGMFQESENIKELRGFLPKYFDAVKYKGGTIPKRGGVGEFLKGNGGGFEKYDELKSYKPFYDRDVISVSKWAKWRNDGIQQMNGDNCPFCTHNMEHENISKQNETISKVFKSSALSTANAVLEFIISAVEKGYIKEDAVQALQSYIGNSSKEDDLLSELKQLALETEYLNIKIEKICQFRPMNVSREQLDEIELNLDDMVIEERQISKFYATEFMQQLCIDIKEKISELKKNTGRLKGLFIQYQNKMEKLIDERREDINHFFALAGFPYGFVLKGNGEGKALSYLVPANLSDENKVEQPENHLSWGEKNAFSLVMFMFEAVSDNADLIVLDDPITSFDKDKKFAVIRRMFDNQKISFKGRTVLMLTHDMQPIIDYVHGNFFGRLGLTTPVRAMYLRNEDGTVSETEITKTDLLNTVELTKKMAEDSQQEMAVRVVNLRKYVELVKADFASSPEYEILSNIIHGRQTPVDKENQVLDDEIIENGYKYINKFIAGADYSQIIAQLGDGKLIALLDSTDMYVKVIAIRLLFERHDNLLSKLRKKYPATCKFVNETNHVENDYIFQLNPLKFFEIPECYMVQLNDFLQKDSGLK